LKTGWNELLLKIVNHGGENVVTFTANERIKGVPLDLAAALLETPAERSGRQRNMISGAFRLRNSEEVKTLQADINALAHRRRDIEETLPTVMVMEELAQPRASHVLLRGDYRQPGPEVFPGTPGRLPPMADGMPPNRYGLALWLTDPANPLTARVAVNRIWQMLFGRGIVKTSNDFGAQGEWPSHPDLLDRLAVDFVENRWDVKHLLKQIVRSSAYRRSSTNNNPSRARDPENRWLARGPRTRLQAEMIRDQALAVSGLLVEKIGGPSVKPYQPPGLWLELNDRPGYSHAYQHDSGTNLSRRSLYTYWKRASPPPAMSTFDAPDREICTLARPNTNTPLQALVLMNDPTFVEAARTLATRVGLRHPDDVPAAIRSAFEGVTSRLPSEAEIAILHHAYDAELARFSRDEQAARELITVGESPCDPTLAPAKLAALTIVASVILNLDEAVTKG
jgi:hypothetical protein